MTNSNPECNEYFDQYWRHASVLRYWFVGFGVGALALLVSTPTLFEGYEILKKWFVVPLFIGVALQISLTFLNKIIHWVMYRGLSDSEYVNKNKKLYDNCIKLSDSFRIDFYCDLLTMTLYGLAGLVLLIMVC